MKPLAIRFACFLICYALFCAFHMNLDARAESECPVKRPIKVDYHYDCFLEPGADAIEMVPGSTKRAVDRFFNEKGWNEG